MRSSRLHFFGCKGPLSPNLLIHFFALLLFAATTSLSCRAQFSGPALGPSTPVNPQVVPTTDPAILYPAMQEIHLDTGDLITVHVYSVVDYSPTARVSVDGTVQLPLIGLISVRALSLTEAAKRIADSLAAAGMYRDPQVTIQLVESPNQVATVTGEAHGVVPLSGERRLFDVLAAAGGLPPTASHIITIDRPGLSQPIVVDLGTNPSRSKFADVPIFAKDTIVVPRIGVVYVLGAFKTQGAVPIVQNSPLTLMQVAAISGGTGFEGRSGDLKLIRAEGTDKKVIKIDMKRIMSGKDPDPVLQADDIVFLPTDAMKAAIKSGGLGTLLGLASILAVASH